MEENWTDALEHFSEVWQRVQGQETALKPCEAPSAHETIENLIRSEAAGEQLYNALARLTEGRSADTLQAMASECRQNLKRLQTEYFMDTGDTLVPKTEPLPYDGLLGYLRRAYLREGAAERAYLNAAASADSGGRSGMYGELSRLCGRRRQKIYELVGRMLG